MGRIGVRRDKSASEFSPVRLLSLGNREVFVCTVFCKSNITETVSSSLVLSFVVIGSSSLASRCTSRSRHSMLLMIALMRDLIPRPLCGRSYLAY